jgi:hypothetical protein
MDADLKTKWVEALRSGEYLQSNGYLREPSSTQDRFCCLGVLAEVQGAKWNVSAPTIDGIYAIQNSGWLKQECAGGLPLGDQMILSDMNDGKIGPRASFTEIADYIETHIPDDVSRSAASND